MCVARILLFVKDDLPDPIGSLTTNVSLAVTANQEVGKWLHASASSAKSGAHIQNMILYDYMYEWHMSIQWFIFKQTCNKS